MKRLTCTKCGESKTVSHFSPNKYTSRGYQSWCKDCFNARRREKYAADKQPFVEYEAELRAELRREREWYRTHHPRPDKPWNKEVWNR